MSSVFSQKEISKRYKVNCDTFEKSLTEKKFKYTETIDGAHIFMVDFFLTKDSSSPL